MELMASSTKSVRESESIRHNLARQAWTHARMHAWTLHMFEQKHLIVRTIFALFYFRNENKNA